MQLVCPKDPPGKQRQNTQCYDYLGRVGEMGDAGVGARLGIAGRGPLTR